MGSYFELEKRISRFRKHPHAAGGRKPPMKPAPPAPVSANGAKPSNGTGVKTSTAKSRAASYGVRAFNAPFSFRVPGIVPPERQPTSMVCWATVTTMMVDWRQNRSNTIPSVIGNIGSNWLAKFTSNGGLTSSEKGSYLAAAGLVAEPPMSYSIEGWLQLLRTYGPLWVTTDEDPSEDFAIHARIMVGIEGDGTADGTSVRIVDPATATEYSETVTVFTQKFESEAMTATGRFVFRSCTGPRMRRARSPAVARRNRKATGCGLGRFHGECIAPSTMAVRLLPMQALPTPAHQRTRGHLRSPPSPGARVCRRHFARKCGASPAGSVAVRIT